jgi:hypothetical protein
MTARSRRDPWPRISGAFFVVGAVIGLVGNALHPHIVDAGGVVSAIATNGGWVGIHLAIMVAILLIIGGLVGLTDQLRDTPAGPLARMGLAAALLGGATVVVSTSIDGFVMKALSVAWASAPALEAAAGLRQAIAIKELDFGIWSMGMLVFFGAAFACFGIAIATSRRYPAWFGWIAVLGAAGAALAALMQIAASGEVQAAETLFLASSVLLTLWVFALGVAMWRAPEVGFQSAPSVDAVVAPVGP